ncbi:hypothetical protein NQ318_005583 [Aromia moschata]|uniref:Rho-GAP domain-containing protein n=1 Tax=Aromia moschata TaxID=1265417 RepID=A0AAV8XL34_9CUCU|nr:hypothetical protein NQ318_005583 [Aromia moschata]
MLMNDCANRAVVREHVVDYLIAQKLPCPKKFKSEGLFRRILGDSPKKSTKVEFRMKDREGERLVRVYDRKIFGVSLQKLDVEDVKLKTGHMLPIPPLVHDLCEFILENAATEGIFRKAGSSSRQADIKSKIDGKKLITTEELDVIDVAAVLKYFLRQLPSPLVPHSYHKLFIACYDSDNTELNILLACLLLPIENLNLLTYMMQFFAQITAYSSLNKMTSYNLAVCIAPNIFAVVDFSAEKFSKITGITKALIEGSSDIGDISGDIQRQVHLEKGFNHLKEKPANKFLINVIKGLNFMAC